MRRKLDQKTGIESSRKNPRLPKRGGDTSRFLPHCPTARKSCATHRAPARLSESNPRFPPSILETERSLPARYLWGCSKSFETPKRHFPFASAVWGHPRKGATRRPRSGSEHSIFFRTLREPCKLRAGWHGMLLSERFFGSFSKRIPSCLKRSYPRFLFASGRKATNGGTRPAGTPFGVVGRAAVGVKESALYTGKMPFPNGNLRRNGSTTKMGR